MKKSILFGLALCGVSTAAMAQDAYPYTINELVALRINPIGNAVAAQDILGNALIIHTDTGIPDFYAANYPGNGNCVANNGMLVGQTMTGVAVLIKDGYTASPEGVQSATLSSFNGVTPDGTRAGGYIDNPDGDGVLYVPFYVDIDGDDVTQPKYLPYPAKDFVGATPQFINVTWISDDGKTMAGAVQDDTGFYSYPIVFQQDEEGNWNYTLPSEPLFNPEGLPLPQWPHMEIEVPNLFNYLNAETQAEWIEYLEEGFTDSEITQIFLDGGLVTEEEYEAYMEAVGVYEEQLKEFYDAIDRYWEELAAVTAGSSFAPNMALSPDGKILAAAKMITDPADGMTDTARGYVVYLFNLEDGSYTSYPTPLGGLIPYQILSDGTLIVVSPSLFAVYVLQAGAEDFISFADYLKSTNPTWLPWLEENLSAEGPVYNEETGKYEIVEYLTPGLVSYNADMTIMAGGLLTEELFTYIYGTNLSGVESLESESQAEGLYRVYNLQGMKVMETPDAGQLKSLKGLYIVNGKKIIF